METMQIPKDDACPSCGSKDWHYEVPIDTPFPRWRECRKCRRLETRRTDGVFSEVMTDKENNAVTGADHCPPHLTDIDRLRARITELEDHPIWSSDHDQKYLELLAKKDRRIEELERQLAETEEDMHLRIRADYDKTVADCWRRAVDDCEKDASDLRAEVEKYKRLDRIRAHVRIPKEQIDKAWEYANSHLCDESVEVCVRTLAKLGIDAGWWRQCGPYREEHGDE